MKTLLAFFILGSAAMAQSPTYTVQKFGGRTILVPNGVIKSGPRSYSASDPANPYRTRVDYNGQSGYQRATQSKLPVVNRNGNGRVEPRGSYSGPTFGTGVTIIINPYAR